jgi:hypothetical protein
MKSKHLLCLIAIVLFSANTYAQDRVRDFPDSLRLELPDYNTIVTFEMKQMLLDKTIITNFPDSLSKMLALVKKGLPDDLSNVGPQKIDIRYLRTMYSEFIGKEHTNGRPLNIRLDVTIHKPDPEVTKMTIIQGQVAEVLPPAWEIRIFAENYRVLIYAENFSSLEAITKENFAAVMNKIETDPKMPYIGRKSIVTRMIIKNHQIVHDHIEYKTPGDYLGIHPHAGVGLVQGTLYPELGISTAIYLSNRFGAMRSRIELGLETKFLVGSFGETFQTTRATFLSLGYARNFQRNNARSRWSGIGVGWLAHQSVAGTPVSPRYFSDNTFKLFLVTDIGSSKLNLVPEVYFKDFSHFDLGLKLSYKF